MGRYNFASPGAAAGDALLDTLARQRAEARQDMLNQITAQNAESQRAMTAQNIKDSQFNILRQRVNDTESNLDTNQDLSGLDPDILAEMQKRGHVKKHGAPTASVGTSTDFQLPNASAPGPENSGDDSDHSADPMLALAGDASPAPPTPPAPEGNYFIGRREDRDRTKHANALNALLPQLNDPKLSQLQKIMLIQAATEEDKLPGQAYTAAQPENTYKIFDQNTGALSEAPAINGIVPKAGPGDPSVLTRTRQPRLPVDHGTFIGPARDAQGTVVPNKAVVMVNGRMEIQEIPDGGVLQKPPTGGAGSGKSAQMPAALRNHLDKARGAAMGKAGVFSNSAPDPQKLAEYQSAQDNFISAYPTTPDVRDTIGEIIRHPEDTRSLDELVQAHQGAFGSDKELADFVDLLRVVKGS